MDCKMNSSNIAKHMLNAAKHFIIIYAFLNPKEFIFNICMNTK